MKDLIKALNNELDDNYKFNHITILPCYTSYIDDSILSRDVTWCTPIIVVKLGTNVQLDKFVLWVNNKLFAHSVELLKLGKTNYCTELVRLNIAITMIDKFEFITKAEREELQNKLRDTYYNRKYQLLEYFCKEIIELPF